MSVSSLARPGRFLYFGFGSNLLRERLRLANKSAKFQATGRLSGYRLEFADPSHSLPQSDRDKAQRTWHGGAATIVEADAQKFVFGTVWSLADGDSDSLDSQEGVDSGIYERISVTVRLLDSGQEVRCRSYRMVRCQPMAPSPHYLDIILRGAVQSGFPADYVDNLRKRQHNGYAGECIKYFEVLRQCAAAADDVPPCQIDALRGLQF
ncbi:hypothetical protein BOX15_Mlig001450g1 [Macrostomum lignano]|uniref:gamma-glutamylcyclotransferase n=1 Tax=Macrostomum lignano TaxID=282301 RepID=A0A267F1B3_9PLAT|nr:hypothetical protein BOX15_Mlig001450g1 [Macrostomum lignano]